MSEEGGVRRRDVVVGWGWRVGERRWGNLEVVSNLNEGYVTSCHFVSCSTKRYSKV